MVLRVPIGQKLGQQLSRRELVGSFNWRNLEHNNENIYGNIFTAGLLGEGWWNPVMEKKDGHPMQRLALLKGSIGKSLYD